MKAVLRAFPIDEEQPKAVFAPQDVDDVSREIEIGRDVPDKRPLGYRHGVRFSPPGELPVAVVRRCMALEKGRLAFGRSRLRVGPVRAQGVPAILIASSMTVLAVGLARAFDRIAPVLPETFRELRKLLADSRDAKALPNR